MRFLRSLPSSGFLGIFLVFWCVGDDLPAVSCSVIAPSMVEQINPIVPGFAPDPSIVRVGDWHYLATSSFHIWPGLPIYASRDLVSWKHIGNAISRQGQLSLSGARTHLFHKSADSNARLATGGLYAPTIRYFNNTFYVVCTNSIRASPNANLTLDLAGDVKDNFIITSNDIWANEWSQPVRFNFSGIDPDIYFEDNKTYIAGAGMSSQMMLFEVDVKTGKKLTGEKAIWAGTGGPAAEAPHIYKRVGWYQLMIAEGGTHDRHMATMARSSNIWGPYEPSPHNPVVTAVNTSEYIQHVGHCDAVEDKEGSWWGACLGVRKDEDGRWNLGRETFLTPGMWDQGWLSFQRVKTTLSRPLQYETREPFSAAGNIGFVYIRDPDFSNYNISSGGETCVLTASSTDFDHYSISPTFVGNRQRTLVGRSEATLQRDSSFQANSSLKAGLAVYKDEHRFMRVYYDAPRSSVAFQLINRTKNMTKIAEHKLDNSPESITFQIRYTEKEYQVFYSTRQGSENGFTLLAGIDTLDLVDQDFVGPILGIFAVPQDGGQNAKYTGLSLQ